MAGKPQRSGGKREGAGRPPASFRLKMGDELIITERIGEMFTERVVGQVVEITRTKLIVRVGDRDIVFVR